MFQLAGPLPVLPNVPGHHLAHDVVPGVRVGRPGPGSRATSYLRRKFGEWRLVRRAVSGTGTADIRATAHRALVGRGKAYRCPYAARQVAVKAKYGLWVTSAEKDALARVLASCPSQTLPTPAAFVLGGGRDS